MAGTEDESADSRTSLAGRKRALQDSAQYGNAPNTSELSGEERGAKRVKEDHEPSTASTAGHGIETNIDLPLKASVQSPGANGASMPVGEKKSVFALLKEQKDNPESPQAETQSLLGLVKDEARGNLALPGSQTASGPSVPAVAWNKGIQGGLRTSFGNKAQRGRNANRIVLADEPNQALQLETVSNAQDSAPPHVDAATTFFHGESSVTASDPNRSEKSVPDQKLDKLDPSVKYPQDHLMKFSPAERKSYMTARHRVKKKEKKAEQKEQKERRPLPEQLKAIRTTGNAGKQTKAEREATKIAQKEDRRTQLEHDNEEPTALIAKYGWPLPEEHRATTAMIKEGKTLFPSMYKGKHTYSNKAGSWNFDEIFDPQGKPISVRDFSFESFAPAFLRNNASKWEATTLKVLKTCFKFYRKDYYNHLIGLKVYFPDVESPLSLPDIQRQTRLLLGPLFGLQSTGHDENLPSASHPKIANSNPIGNDQLLEEMHQAKSRISSRPASIADEDPSQDTDSDSSVSDESGSESSVQLNAPEQEMEYEFEKETVLRQRYFPASDPTVPICLACAHMGHATPDCPDTHCTTCGQTAKHSKKTCPLNRRCGKCRERGHTSRACPEKLARAQEEGIICDICGSQDHIEHSCHFIWRSFEPSYDEILQVRNITRDCYNCGGSDHYGPECGLHRGRPIKSGGLTWSKENFLKYVDFGSQNRAISAGVDYSIPARPSKRDFSIKGKANDPITLDDSDDEEFIRPPVQNKNIPRGPINFRSQQRPNQNRPHQPSPPVAPRGPNPPRQSRPIFDHSSRDEGFQPHLPLNQPSFPQPYLPTGFQQSQGTLPMHSIPLPRGPNPANRGGKNGGGARGGAGAGGSGAGSRRRRGKAPNARGGRH